MVDLEEVSKGYIEGPPSEHDAADAKALGLAKSLAGLLEDEVALSPLNLYQQRPWGLCPCKSFKQVLSPPRASTTLLFFWSF